MKVKFYTNNKNLVVATAKINLPDERGRRSGRVISIREEARCHPNDNFDYEFGKKLAYARLKVREKLILLKVLHHYSNCIENMIELLQEKLNSLNYHTGRVDDAIFDNYIELNTLMAQARENAS